ncbi:enoyl-CoA hydratase/isomerase family protein, partial [Streptomyces sp. NPDC004976]
MNPLHTPTAVSPTTPGPPPDTSPSPAPAPLSLTRTGAVLHVRLNPAAQDDVLSTAVLDALIAVLDGLHDQPDLRILVLSSLGSDFCLGADRQE